MCMSNYFLMYVIPSVMVQSYICYVTKPIVEVELSKFSDLALILSADIWGDEIFKSPKEALERKKLTEARSHPTMHLETLEIKFSFFEA